MIVLALIAALSAGPMPEPATASSPDQSLQDPVTLEDVEVTGQTLESLVRDFVAEVAAPNRRRGLARWDTDICVGVANLRAEPAQYIVDRVSTVAEDLGLRPGQPGCTPNVMIVASEDPSGLAEAMIARRKQTFSLGGGGIDRGRAALEDFVASEAPVRWWQLSMPTDSETGARAVRVPGECDRSCSSVFDYAPVITVNSMSRLRTQIVDNFFRVIILIDMNKVAGFSANQLADYIAMVALAQIDPEANTSRYASILNVFDAPETASGLTDWDMAYLQGLYDAQRTHIGGQAREREIGASILRAHHSLRQEPDN